jgi:hypothetical protein
VRPFDPFLPFLAVTGGALLAAFVLRILLERRIGFGACVAIAACGILAWTAIPQAYTATRYLERLRSTTKTLHASAQRLDCLRSDGLADKLPFVDWLSRELPPNARYRLAMDPLDPACVGLRMLPRVAVRPDSDAGYIVFFGEVPPAWRGRFDSGAPGVHRFGANLGYAELRR